MVNLPYQRSEESKSVKSKESKWKKGADFVKTNRFEDYGISEA